MKFGTRDLHKMVLGICEFCNNRQREGKTVLIVLNVIQYCVCVCVCVCARAVKLCDILTVKCV